MQRKNKVDNIRAIAICVVVLGHSIILYSSTWNLYVTTKKSDFLDCVKSIINMFQMPLFFSLSGYLFAGRKHKTNYIDFVIKKAQRLLVPFVVVGILFMIPLKKLLNYPGYQNVNFYSAVICLLRGTETGHLWYLPTLFLIMCMAYWIDKVTGKKVWRECVILLGTVVIHLVSGKIPGIVPYQSLVLKYFCSFWFGKVICDLKLDVLSGKIKYFIGIMICITVPLFSRVEELDILSAMAIVLAIYILVPAGRYVILSRLSKDSFGIYLFHSPLIYITFTYMADVSPVLVVGTNILWGGVALVLTELLHRTIFKFFIGEKNERKSIG